MDIKDVPFTVVDWENVIPEEHPGESGKAFWKVFALVTQMPMTLAMMRETSAGV